MKETTYQFVAKMLRKRLVQCTPITEAELETLSLSETLNLLFALQGSWGSRPGLPPHLGESDKAISLYSVTRLVLSAMRSPAAEPMVTHA